MLPKRNYGRNCSKAIYSRDARALIAKGFLIAMRRSNFFMTRATKLFELPQRFLLPFRHQNRIVRTQIIAGKDVEHFPNAPISFASCAA
jgi:hypothetical protein